MLMDATGQPFYAWDENEPSIEAEPPVLEHRRFHTVYDALRRPVEQQLQIEDGSSQIIEQFIYGEGQPDDLNRNLRGQVYQHYDSSGLVTNQRFDFKGNLLEVTRQLVRDYKAPVIDWSEGFPTNSLEFQMFTVRTEYDALNRPTLLTSPDQSVTRPVYNEANLLEQMYVRLRGAATETVFVENIDYDAKGQRTLIEYGNGVRTTYAYNPETFRLVRLLTTRISNNARLQDLQYTYDPVGNITEIRDDAQQTVFFNNAVVSPNTRYEYDALYRLMQAEGREHAGQQGNSQPDHEDVPVMPLPHPNDSQAMRNYTERYEYDGVGNILAMIHGATNGNWTRRYQYAEESNRLLATSRPGDGEGEFSAAYTYDTHGNMTTMPHLLLMQWDYQDRLKATSRQVVNEGTPETTYYVYDSSGQRVRKVTERQAAFGETPNRKNERIYFGGFEIYREYGGDGETVTLEREMLHVMDDQQRIALVETKIIDTDNSSETPLLAPIIRYQLGNHLGSVSLEVDAAGAVISYEEYHPYGTSAYRSRRSAAEVSLKRYRYTEMERDEETGLAYHGARYYAAWLGRWIATDPIGLGDGVNQYNYVGGNPIVMLDVTGMNGVTIAELEHQIAVNESAAELATGEELLRLNEEHNELNKQYNKLSQEYADTLKSAEASQTEAEKAAFEQRAAAIRGQSPPTEVELHEEARNQDAESVAPTEAPTDQRGAWPTGYSYVIRQEVGYIEEGDTAEEMMLRLQDRPNDFFPFTVVNLTDPNAGIVEGHKYDLQHTRFLGDKPNEVVVESANSTSFTFLTLESHFDGPGARITFTTYEENGVIYLEHNANAPDAGLLNSTVAPTGAASFGWKVQAARLRDQDEILLYTPEPIVNPYAPLINFIHSLEAERDYRREEKQLYLDGWSGASPPPMLR